MTSLAVRPAPLAGVAAAILGAAAGAEAAIRAGGPLSGIGVLVAVAVVAPLALSPLWPVAAALMSTTACLSGLGMSTPVTGAGTLALAATLFVAGWRARPPTAILLVLPFSVYAALPIGASGAGGRASALGLLTVAAATSAGGLWWQLREQKDRRRVSEESAAASQLEYAARGERASIARELHDVVAHHITIIALQAEAARLGTPDMPADGAKRLSAIGDTARTALTEMRRLLGVLREDADAETELSRPQPGLGQLNALLDEVRDASEASVRLIVSGPVTPLDPGIELTVYRIVQEALTNVQRHAPGASVDVELKHGNGQLYVRIHDNGPGAAHAGSPAQPADRAGHGLTGMRERAAMAGGRLTTGPGHSAGFLIEAVLPAKETTE